MKWFSLLLVGALALSACDQPQVSSNPSNVIAESLASSVQLFTEREDGKRRAGSGVVLSVEADGRALILTASHLVEPLTEQTIFVQSTDDVERFEARIVSVDSELDVAVLEANGLKVRPVRLKTSARLGDNVWVVSFPWGRRGTVVNGFVSQITDAWSSAPLPIEGPAGLIDAAVSYGTSGGGVFDSRTGQLIGIVRGYRTARLQLPGPEAGSLELPIAGETTVIPSYEILCLLNAAKLEGRVDLPALAEAEGRSCNHI